MATQTNEFFTETATEMGNWPVVTASPTRISFVGLKTSIMNMLRVFEPALTEKSS